MSEKWTTWDEIDEQIYTPEERSASELRVAFLCALIDARNEKRITQKELERLSGIKQPMIARIERGTSSPTLDTMLRILAPLGKTLAIVPING
jgi:DNA-binding XRE family transcriptional regulator